MGKYFFWIKNWFFRASSFGYRVKGVCPLLLPLVSLTALLIVFVQIFLLETWLNQSNVATKTFLHYVVVIVLAWCAVATLFNLSLNVLWLSTIRVVQLYPSKKGLFLHSIVNNLKQSHKFQPEFWKISVFKDKKSWYLSADKKVIRILQKKIRWPRNSSKTLQELQ